MLRRRRYFLTPHATWLFIGNNTPKHLCGAGESFQFSPADKFGRRMSLVFSSVVYIRADQMYIISFNMKKAGKILLSFLFLVFRYLPSGVSFSYQFQSFPSLEVFPLYVLMQILFCTSIHLYLFLFISSSSLMEYESQSQTHTLLIKNIHSHFASGFQLISETCKFTDYYQNMLQELYCTGF